MRRQTTSFLLGSLSFAWLFAWNVGAAYAVDVPCYCRYTDPNRLFGAESKLYCMGEAFVAGKVEQGNASACVGKCAAQNSAFVAVAGGDPAGFGETYNMVKEETAQCVFFPGDFSEIQGWSSNYADCKSPLNAIGKSATPEACSFCYCKFKTGAGDCTGKLSFVHATGNPSSCPTLCAALNMDAVGNATDDYSRCDYKSTDHCAKPVNPTSEGCKNEMANAEHLKDVVTGRGSVVTMPLPLSNVSISSVIGRILNTILGVVGAVALLMFVWGGLQWMTAAGNTEKVAKAKKTLVWAALGLVAIFSSYAVLGFVINALK